MNRILSLFFLLHLALFSVAQESQSLSLEDVWASGKFYARGVYGIRHMNDGQHYMVNEKGNVVKYAYTQAESVGLVFDKEEASKAGYAAEMSDYDVSESGNWILLESGCESIYRHSKQCSYDLWDVRKKEIKPLFDNKKVFYATLSPDEKKVAFVYENNLYYQEISSAKVTQVSHDGKENSILNGKSDWVYEEEFVLVKGFEWSPDGKKLAYYRFDETEVKEYVIPVYEDDSYPELYKYKYPKAGEDNSKIQVKIYSLETEATSQVDLGKEEDIYIPRIKWTKDPNTLSVQRMNRLQNNLEILLADARSGKTRTVYQEYSSTYIDITDDLTFLDGNRFILSSDKDGYNHLYYYDARGELISRITSGSYDVISYHGYDPKSKRVFYESAEKSPLERHFYSVKLNGKSKKLLTPEAGNNSASFSHGYDYFIHKYSNASQPERTDIKSIKGKQQRLLEDNGAFKETWDSYGLSTKEFMEVPAADGTPLNAYMIKPKGFDASKSYPLLMFCYGGPGSQMVRKRWQSYNDIWFHYLAQQGYIVACVDNRGTGARGSQFKKMTYKNLGEIEAADQIAAAKHFGKQSYIDAERIGIFGWSYGGYLSTLSLLKGEGTFKMAVAVAPVSDWRFYDNIYTERYMQRPVDNPEGYERSSLLQYANQLDGSYLLVHGTFDDNVHPQNARELTKLLVRYNKPFDNEMYVNKNHGIYGGYTRLHLFGKISRFVLENL